MKRFPVFLAALLLSLGAAAQDFIPMVRSFTARDYGAGRQNWSACSGPVLPGTGPR